MVEITDAKRNTKDKKVCCLSAKISVADYEFIKQNGISPSMLVRAAIDELRLKMQSSSSSQQ